MKNILLFTLLISTFCAFAQNRYPEFSRSYNASTTINYLVGGISTLSTEYLFPDTTIVISENNQSRKPTIHGIAIELNPQSAWYDLPNLLYYWQNINSWTDYYLENINIRGVYTRNLGNHIVDTLIIHIREAPLDKIGWNSISSPWVLMDYSADTIFFHPIYYSKQNPFTSDSIISTIKIPLRASDSTCTVGNQEVIGNFWGTLNDRVPITANASMQCIISFKPGYTWNANQDTLQSMNSFKFSSYEENGDNGGTGTYPSYTKSDWQMSYVLDKQNLYDTTNITGFGNTYLPPYYYSAKHPYEHHDVTFVLSAGNTSLKPLTKTIWLDVLGGISNHNTSADSFSLTNTSWINASINNQVVKLAFDANFTQQNNQSTLHLYKTYDSSYYEKMVCMQNKITTNIENSSSDISIIGFYPNPTINKSTLEINCNDCNDLEILIYSIDGKLIRTISKGKFTKKIEIETSDLSSGIYFYQVNVGKESAMGKFIKN